MKYDNIQHVGNQPQRKDCSYSERIFADEWEELNKRIVGTNGGYGALELLLHTKDICMLQGLTADTIIDEINQRDAFVAATIIQWLGTKCGVVFLKDCENKISIAHKAE